MPMPNENKSMDTGATNPMAASGTVPSCPTKNMSVILTATMAKIPHTMGTVMLVTCCPTEPVVRRPAGAISVFDMVCDSMF
mgnify:CR=1 FL=1